MESESMAEGKKHNFPTAPLTQNQLLLKSRLWQNQWRLHLWRISTLLPSSPHEQRIDKDHDEAPIKNDNNNNIQPQALVLSAAKPSLTKDLITNWEWNSLRQSCIYYKCIHNDAVILQVKMQLCTILLSWLPQEMQTHISAPKEALILQETTTHAYCNNSQSSKEETTNSSSTTTW